ncbi:hypothetical protein [Fibrella aquatica]|uniref:hypothetical protein n=1 Tax=Fibrella aquatica TaxID=3242487 RepID=UPI003522F1D2
MKNRFDEIFDALIKWYKAGGIDELPPDLKAHALRWMKIRDYILSFNPKHDGEVASHFSIEWKLSEAQVYHEISHAKRFYAHCAPAVADFEKIVLTAQIKDLRQKAIAKGNLAVAANCDKNLIKLGGYDQPAPQAEIGAGVINVHMQFNPALVGAKRDPGLLAQVKRHLGERAARELLISDVDFEDIAPAEPFADPLDPLP